MIKLEEKKKKKELTICVCLVKVKSILCFGDSITYGVGEKPKKGWVGRLKEFFEARGPIYYYAYNLGIPGGYTRELVERFDVECSARMIKLHKGFDYAIIISIGTNDSKWYQNEERDYRGNEEEYRENIKKLIEKGKNKKAKLVFIGLTPVDNERTTPYMRNIYLSEERVEKFNSIMKEECEKEKIPFLDVFNLLKKKHLLEGIHPNSKGYDLMWEKIKPFLEENKII